MKSKKLVYRDMVRSIKDNYWLVINLRVPGKWQSNTHLKIIASVLRERGALCDAKLRSIPWEGR